MSQVFFGAERSSIRKRPPVAVFTSVSGRFLTSSMDAEPSARLPLRTEMMMPLGVTPASRKYGLFFGNDAPSATLSAWPLKRMTAEGIERTDREPAPWLGPLDWELGPWIVPKIGPEEMAPAAAAAAAAAAL